MKIIRLLNPRTLLIILLVAALLATPRLILAGPLSAVDDADTVVLLHMDGAEGSTLFTDESGKTWSSIGDPRITGLTARFEQSLRLGSGNSILSPDTEQVYFAHQDFSVDLWILFTAPVGIGETVVVFSQEQDPNNFMSIGRSSTTWDFTVKSVGIDIVSLSADRPITPGAWTHIAVVRSGDTFRMFENGMQIGSIIDVDGLPNFAAPLYIGSSLDSLQGNLDEFRISRIARWTENFTPPAAPYEAPTPTPTGTPTVTTTPSPTPTGTLSINTSTPIPIPIIVITVPVIISIEDANTNANTNTGSSAGSFYAVTPVTWQGQGGVAVFGGLSCGGYYLRVRAYVDDNRDRMMAPAEGITGLQVFFLDQTYARLGSTYTLEGRAEFCIPVTQYGKAILIDIPYLQLFGTVQVPEQPNQDLEIWFPGDPPALPLFLP